MRSYFVYMILFLASCQDHDKRTSQMIFVMGNDSFQRQKIDILLEMNDFTSLDTLTFGEVVDKKIMLEDGTYNIKIKSNLGKIEYAAKVELDSILYIDLRYDFGKSREELRALELVKKHNDLDTAYITDTSEKYLPRIILNTSTTPFKYQ
jgi:hypothetical protein